MPRGLVIAAMGCLVVAGCASGPGALAEPCQLATPIEPLPIEPELARAFAEALDLFPPEARARLETVELVRERRYELPPRVPLIARIYAAAAYAVYDPREHSVIVYDAAFTRRPAWSPDDPAPTPEDLAEFLAMLAPALAKALDLPPDPAPPPAQALWARLVHVLDTWAPEDPLPPDPPLGDPRVLDRLVAMGPDRVIDHPLDLRATLVHELAHALQLAPGAPRHHLTPWSSLSAWRWAEGGRPYTPAFHEHPSVLLSLAIADTRGPLARYAPSPDARFINRYAEYEPREDYAESVRAFIERPRVLLETAPEKYLFINALGYNLHLDTDAPGPLWREPEGADELAHIHRGFCDMLGAEPPEIPPSFEAVLAILRAHAHVIDAQALPRADELDPMPTDLPASIRRAFVSDDLRILIDSVPLGPSNAIVQDTIIRELIARESYAELMTMIFHSGSSIPDGYRRAVAALTELEDQDQRAHNAASLLREPRVLPREEHRAFIEREAAHWHEADRPLAAMMLRLADATHEPEAPEADRLLAEIASESRAREPHPDAASALLIAAELELLRDRPARAEALLDRIAGDHLGSIRRVEGMIAIAEHAADPAHPALERARRLAEAHPSPRLRQELLKRIHRTTAALNAAPPSNPR